MEGETNTISKRAWYKTWWGILLLLFVWPFVLSFWVWKRNWSLGMRLGTISGLWVALLVSGVISYLSKGSIPSTQTQPLVTQPSNSSPTSAPTANPTLPQVPKTTKDLIRDALKKTGSTGDYQIDYDSQTKTASLSYGGKDSTFWDEKAIVEGLFSSFVKNGKEIFKIDGVETLKMTVETEFTDSYGKSNVEEAASLSMAKKEFQKYDWDSLRFQPIYYQMKRSALELYINPALIRKIKLDEVKLKY